MKGPQTELTYRRKDTDSTYRRPDTRTDSMYGKTDIQTDLMYKRTNTDRQKDGFTDIQTPIDRRSCMQRDGHTDTLCLISRKKTGEWRDA